MHKTDKVFQTGDMSILNDNSSSEIQKFYAGKNILLTGATGFLGILILEKLLRTCTEISKIYIMLRPKKGISIEERIKRRFEDGVFNELRKINPNFMEKLVPIQGDLNESPLALHPEDRERLVKNVNILIHNAAIVQFRSKVSLLLRANVIGTQEMLKLATECSHLEVFIYVSTAYSHPATKFVEEKCYPSPADIKYVEDIIRADEENASGTSVEVFNDITETFNNMYTFSKAVAESVVEDYSRTAPFPCIIYRPSIVSMPHNGPMRAWTANLHGMAMPVMFVCLGFIHMAPMPADIIVDNIPGDMTINYLLALVWDHVTHRKSCKLEVYNYGSSDWNPITAEFGRKTILNVVGKYPLLNMMWYPTLTFISNFYVFMALNVFLMAIPAAIFDFIQIVRKKKAMALNMVSMALRNVDLIYPFVNSTWIIKTKKAKNLVKRLNAADLKEFNFDLSKVDWREYVEVYISGVKIFLKEKPDDLILAKKKYRMLQILHYTVCSLAVLGLLFFLYNIACSFFSY